jgi:hypothetical protein
MSMPGLAAEGGGRDRRKEVSEVFGMSFLHGDPFIAAEGWRIGVWAFAFAGLAGFFAGLLYRAGAVIVLSFAAVIAALVFSIGNGWSIFSVLLAAVGFLIALQLGYLLGVATIVMMSKLKATAIVRSLIQSLFKQDTAP